MTRDYQELYGCTFEPDPRIVELERRYKELYDAPDERYNVESKLFNRWCKHCGYTRDEIKRAKQYVSSLR